MSDPNPRFAPQNKTVHDRLSTNTVGLVALSDFRKRRAEALEQQEREAREAATATPPDRSQTATPSNNNATNSAAGSDTNSKDDRQNQRKKKKAKVAKSLVSFGGDEEGEDDGESLSIKPAKSKPKPKPKTSDEDEKKEDTPDGATDDADDAARSGSEDPQKKITPNPSAVIVPRALTKSALRKEAAEKEALRKEFLLLQAAVKATEIAIPFVFYDGTSTPGGIVRVKKGDHVWLFLDKSRKVGAQLRVGAEKSVNYRRDWARVSVDDLILVRGTIIIPHHYEFYYFIMNQTKGPRGQILFDYSADAPPNAAVVADSAASLEDEKPSAAAEPGLSKPKKAGSGGGGVQVLTDIRSLEGWADDPTFTKVVDRRWYQRNKHIYPASTWQNFDPEKDYQSEIKRDTGGNAFFFGK